MHYNGPVIRPQTDADSVFIEVTVGCTHDSCTFCNFYDGYPFRVAPLEQVEADLKEAAQYNPHAKKYGHLAEIRMRYPRKSWQCWQNCSKNICRKVEFPLMPVWMICCAGV